MSNSEVVQQAYEAFGRGDLPGMMALCTPDVQWSYFGQVPWAGEFKGHAEVPRFFEILGSTLEFESFEPQTVIEGRDAVTVLGTEKCKVRATGARYDNNHWCHIFFINGGKITRYTGWDSQAI